MITATLDTNVLISGVLFNGPPREIIKRAISGKFTLVLSVAVLEELEEVLRRPKFGLPPAFVQITARELEIIATIVYPTSKHKAVKSDPKDDMIVDCAVEGHSHYIVSGDKHLLSLTVVEGIPVVAPNDFLNKLASQ